jgi:hypothetical protein
MKAVLVVLLSIMVAVPAIAGAPANGTYTSTDIGGTMLPGRYSESWYPTKLSVDNTLNEQSWNGALGTQWWWYCPWIDAPPTLVFNNVNGAGNGIKIWYATYTGGYCWIDGAGPWAGGDASYLANINTWSATITETYVAFQEVGTVRNHDATATFVTYPDCMSLSTTNAHKLGDTVKTGPLPADYPSFWNWIGCFDQGPVGPGEWGDIEGITFTIDGCQTVKTEQSTWGGVKAMYRK